MIRKLILTAAAAALLGGCATSGYSYRQGNGDYYHGAPSVEYRYYSPYYSPYYGGPYGYYGSPYGSYRYAYPAYGYRQYHYGHPHGYPQRYYPGTRRPTEVDRTPDSNGSHWRNLDRLPRRSRGSNTIAPNRTPMPDLRGTPTATPQSNSVPRPSGSALGERIRRAKTLNVDSVTP